MGEAEHRHHEDGRCILRHDCERDGRHPERDQKVRNGRSDAPDRPPIHMPADAQPVQQCLDEGAADHREREHGKSGEEAACRPQGPGHGVGGPVGEQDEPHVPGKGVECQGADGFLPHVASDIGIDQPPPLVRRKLARGRDETGPA